MRRIALSSFAFASAVTLATFAAADSPPAAAPSNSSAPPTQQHPTLVPTENADLAIVETAMSDFQRGGFSRLATHLDELKTVMSHAPVSYKTFETSGEITYIHPVDPGDSLALTLLATARTVRGQGGSAIVVPNVYPTAALLLASYADEMHNYQEGYEWAKKGLAMQPGNWMLALEGASCAMALHHPEDAIAVLQAALDGADYLSPEGRARLLRNKGVSLVEIGKLDEAEVALKESIRLMPNNDQARGELNYIARLRAGGQRTDIHIGIPPAQQTDTNAPPGDSGKPQKGN